MTARIALELSQVTASYSERPSDAPLADVSLDVRAGEVLVVLGPNGAGKSTLLRVLAGTLAPRAGHVTLFGERMDRLDRQQIAQKIAVVPQSERVAMGFRVRDVVMMGRAPFQDRFLRETESDRAIVDDMIDRFDLRSVAGRSVSELSGGEQKRVSLARAFAQQTKVLLLDEPGAFLDVRHQIELCDAVASEVTRSNIACVMVMHDLNAAALVATRVLLLRDGRSMGLGTIEETLTWQKLKSTFSVDLYVGVNELTGDRFFVPMRRRDPPS